jgi:hypothetical protein
VLRASLRRPLRGANVIEQFSVGCHPRLIYDAAAAAKSEMPLARQNHTTPLALLKSLGRSIRLDESGQTIVLLTYLTYLKTILVKSFGHSPRPDGELSKIRTMWCESLAQRDYDIAWMLLLKPGFSAFRVPLSRITHFPVGCLVPLPRLAALVILRYFSRQRGPSRRFGGVPPGAAQRSAVFRKGA